MNILDALNIDSSKKTVISLVGGGGKTSIMYRLAKELRDMNNKVLVTTTTSIYYPGQALYDRLYLWDTESKPTDGIQGTGQGSITVIGKYVTEENKLKGIPKELVDELYRNQEFDSILVEADGAKKKPIKAPDNHEPVIPACTSHLIGVIGYDCYGKEIQQDWVHRPHLLAALTGKRLGDMVDEEVIVKLVLSSDGLFKSCPQLAKKILFINKVENSEQYTIAKRIGNLILKQNSYIAGIMIGSLHESKPVKTVMRKVT